MQHKASRESHRGHANSLSLIGLASQKPLLRARSLSMKLDFSGSYFPLLLHRPQPRSVVTREGSVYLHLRYYEGFFHPSELCPFLDSAFQSTLSSPGKWLLRRPFGRYPRGPHFSPVGRSVPELRRARVQEEQLERAERVFIIFIHTHLSVNCIHCI